MPDLNEKQTRTLITSVLEMNKEQLDIFDKQLQKHYSEVCDVPADDYEDSSGFLEESHPHISDLYDKMAEQYLIVWESIEVIEREMVGDIAVSLLAEFVPDKPAEYLVMVGSEKVKGIDQLTARIGFIKLVNLLRELQGIERER